MHVLHTLTTRELPSWGHQFCDPSYNDALVGLQEHLYSRDLRPPLQHHLTHEHRYEVLRSFKEQSTCLRASAPVPLSRGSFSSGIRSFQTLNVWPTSFRASLACWGAPVPFALPLLGKCLVLAWRPIPKSLG